MSSKPEIHILPASEVFKATMLSEMTDMPIVKWGDYTLEIELDELKPEVREIARKELRETPDVAREAKKELKELLKEETDLYVPLDNELWLIRFLRPTKFYPESARDLIKRYYAFKQKHADMYKDLSPSHERNIFQQNILTVQPNRDQLGRRILIIELGKKMENRQGDARRGVQRLRPLPGGRHVGTGNPSLRGRRHLRHGRAVIGADHQVHPLFRRPDRQLVTGQRPPSNKKHSHREPAVHLQSGLRSLQTFPAGKVAQPHNLPRDRP